MEDYAAGAGRVFEVVTNTSSSLGAEPQSMSDGTLSLVSVVVGAVLGFVITLGYDLWKDWRNKSRIRLELQHELKANLHMFPQKRHILKQMLDVIERPQIPLHGDCVPFCSLIYNSHFPIVSASVEIKERVSLHTIYSTLAMIDSTMGGFVETVKQGLDSDSFNDLIGIEKVRLQSLPSVLEVTEKLLKAHLAGSPLDVVHLDMDYEKLKSAEFKKAT